MLLGLRAQPREDTGLSPAETVISAPIVLPKKFLQNEEISVDSMVKNFSKTLDVPAFCLSRHNSNAQLSSKLPAELLSATLDWVRHGGVIPPLHLLYDGPTPICAVDPAPSPSKSGPGMRSSPSATSRPAWPRTPSPAAHVAAADCWVPAQAVLSQPSGSRFQTCWFLHLPLQRRHEMVPEPFSYPVRRFLLVTGSAITGSTDAVPVPSMGTAIEVEPLTSSPSS